MAPSFLSRLRSPQQAETLPLDPQPARRPLPPVGQLRRERRALLREREDRIRDLGGIVLEMIRRDEFREDLVYEQAAELIGLEDRLHELEALLAAATSVRRRTPAVRCVCGAPILWGAHFCGNCGRPAGPSPIVACPVCGHALQADAKFCAGCGTSTGSPAAEA
jgi:predicted nucleic acid-binding Zn ribbon protein